MSPNITLKLTLEEHKLIMAAREEKAREIEKTKRAEVIKNRAQESLANYQKIDAAVRAIENSKLLLNLELQEYKTEKGDALRRAGSYENEVGQAAKALDKLCDVLEFGLAAIACLSHVGVHGAAGIGEGSKTLMSACQSPNTGALHFIEKRMKSMRNMLKDNKQIGVDNDEGVAAKRKRG